jgi:tRNA uridine 5-carboxymethylaminomethyl modification enzyme
MWSDEVIAEVEQDGRYAPYVDRQAAELRDLAANERIAIPPTLDYRLIAGLSNEMVERLNASRPDTLAAASRIRGITPAALAAILVHAKRAQNADKQAA